MENFTEQKQPLGLYDPQFEHDACGIGAVVDIKGRKSHQTVSDALSIVERLEHRAGKDAEGKTGDGVGIMLQISHRFFTKVADELNISLGNEREYGVGMFFFPQNEHLRAQAMKLFELVTRKEGLEFLAWRAVPVDPDAVGQKARDCMPSIWQCFIKKPAKVSKGIDFDRKLYIVRRVFEQASNGTYVPSLSSRTIVYKGMFLVHDLRLFYLDLQDEDYESAIGMVHSRFSTNTNPSWMRAHPNRFILHNGEISTIQSYQSSQIFEAVGISKDVIDKYFTGTVSRVGGIGLEDIQADVEALHNAAFDPLGLDINMQLEDGGAHKFRSGKEEHLFNPQTIHLFQKACFTGDYDTFKQFTHTVDNMGRNGVHLRSLLDFNYAPDGGIPLDEVEPVSSIVKRFKAAAMSYGALSSEAHETIAIALNRLGGRSNTGEGGEPEERYHSESNSKIKQVASARFGVTSKYLVSAEEIQIKLAQGAKPGEGGNLPGAKVYPWIAKTRHSTTGVGLISPPPHHDIYSIEDLAELIYDLKNANRHANINVKLVSEAGVGTIAAGVAKGGAQVILVSGYDGGTGAAPRNSMPPSCSRATTPSSSAAAQRRPGT